MREQAHDASSERLAQSSGIEGTIAATKLDLLSQLLTLLRLQGETIYTANLTAPWALAHPPGRAHFHLVVEGHVVVRSSEIGVATVPAGHLVLLPLGKGHVLEDAAHSPARPAIASQPGFFDSARLVLDHGGGGARTQVVSGAFHFDESTSPIILSALPAIVILSKSDGGNAEWLEALVRFMLAEAHAPSPGSAIMISRLIDVLVVQTLRAWAATTQRDGSGWIGALGDTGVERALTALHNAPLREWTVQDLARLAGMSRSVFAERFASRVGEPPLRYLKNWRLGLAADMLKSGTLRVSEVARRAGYDSDAAFSRAFKTRFGYPPAEARASPRSLDERPAGSSRI